MHLQIGRWVSVSLWWERYSGMARHRGPYLRLSLGEWIGEIGPWFCQRLWFCQGCADTVRTPLVDGQCQWCVEYDKTRDTSWR